ncbi:aminopeptidase P family protein [Flaviflexus equikiangi]|uniref:Xaa-Pro aminopeptidase n=1 Tax=Flaviflexus equikiangi TaxID=2758573 RepID=A0ABS2TE53_9ACTO|nr:aminopeptidase P family protein [Flaviflexus equikiangi]MBM9432930.1 aminopeptidase P family protein [Flaviflexus equikiangi]
MSNQTEDRGSNRSQRPDNREFRTFIGEDWGERPPGPARSDVADFTQSRRHKLGAQFHGQRLVIPAGELRVRSNDTDYRFRAHSAFAHLTGLGGELEPNAVLVLHPVEGEQTHEAVLYFHPRTPRTSEEFWADSRYGEFWVGARPSLEEMSTMTGIRTDHIENLPDALAKDLGQVHIAAITEADTKIDAQIRELRQRENLTEGQVLDEKLREATSELRLRKDAWEIAEIQKAVDITAQGFEDMIAALPRAVEHWRGERVLEGAFAARAREEGNGLGYDTIAAAGNHANTLHWIVNDGQVKDGELVLIDAGAEVDSLYTADITRTLPVNGTFSPEQATVYNAVLEACEASLAKANEPGAKFRELHEAAMVVIARYLEEWGCLPGTAEESLAPDGQYHRRWMPHGTSHHLGLDVHDCAQARRDMYLDAVLEPGMVFTIEPGLYFREDDEKIPAWLRGIGVRIEDDILVTEDGARRLSESIPRTIPAVEEWMRAATHRRS